MFVLVFSFFLCTGTRIRAFFFCIFLRFFFTLFVFPRFLFTFFRVFFVYVFQREKDFVEVGGQVFDKIQAVIDLLRGERGLQSTAKQRNATCTK